MERYHGVRGRARVARIAEAIEVSGWTILRAAKPTEAPFEYRVRTSSGETLDLVCYAFTANRYEQQGRPDNEHRFQVKYGSEFDRPHPVFIDPARSRITLMLGVHDELPLFVAVDPAMHNPTWFSRSVELKERDLEVAKQRGWHGWERDRVETGRRHVLPQQDMRTEALVALRPEHFGTYVLFERIATGMDPGERLLLVDRIAERIAARRTPDELVRWLPDRGRSKELARHPLLLQLGIGADELLDVVGNRFRLLAALRGSVAEHHLGRLLRTVRGVTQVIQIDEDGRPDFEIEYRKRRVRIECKNVLRRLVAKAPRVDFQKTRASKNDPCSRYYKATQFEILAACLHPVTERWEFQFCPTRVLPVHSRCPGRLSEHVSVSGPDWTRDLHPLLHCLAGGTAGTTRS